MEGQEYDTDLDWTEVLKEGETKLYLAAYVGLLLFATIQFVLESSDMAYGIMLTGILVLSTVKALIVIYYYQHLKWEPRIITYLYASAVFGVLLLMAAASYSIT